jgi:hypothetical protein
VLSPLIGFLLSRTIGIVAIQLFLLGAVLPRTTDHDVGTVLITLIVCLGPVAAFFMTRGRKVQVSAARKWFGFACSVVLAVAALAVAVGYLTGSWTILPPPDAGDGELDVRAMWIAVGATVAATGSAWYWARLPWRTFVTLGTGAIVGLWVWMAESRDWFVGSFWYALVVLAVTTTLVGYNIDVAVLRRPAESPR